MRKFNFFCSLILVLSTTIMIVTLGQNLVLRTTAGYTFYFNDTRVVSKISGNYTNSEMSQEIVSFMNSWRPVSFRSMRIRDMISREYSTIRTVTTCWR